MYFSAKISNFNVSFVTNSISRGVSERKRHKKSIRATLELFCFIFLKK